MITIDARSTLTPPTARGTLKYMVKRLHFVHVCSAWACAHNGKATANPEDVNRIHLLVDGSHLVVQLSAKRDYVLVRTLALNGDLELGKCMLRDMRQIVKHMHKARYQNVVPLSEGASRHIAHMSSDSKMIAFVAQYTDVLIRNVRNGHVIVALFNLNQSDMLSVCEVCMVKAALFNSTFDAVSVQLASRLFKSLP